MQPHSAGAARGSEGGQAVGRRGTLPALAPTAEGHFAQDLVVSYM